MFLKDATVEAFRLLASGDPELWRIVAVSLGTTLAALLIATPFAVAAGYLVAAHRFAGRRILIWIGQSALALPTVLIGLLLYMVLSRDGPLGAYHLLFSRPGIVIGQVFIALPVLFAVTLAAVQAIDPRLQETAVTLGAPRWRVMATVLNEARFGILAAVINGFGRVISEVGCAMMVGGNIAGDTRTMTTAIALQTSKGEMAQGIALGFVLVAIAMLANTALVWAQGDASGHGAKA